jgi:hypothetical protein
MINDLIHICQKKIIIVSQIPSNSEQAASVMLWLACSSPGG